MGGARRCLLPFTVTEAEVLLSPVSQLYSPLSVTSSLRMAKVWLLALCSMMYLFPSVSTVEPLSQVTLQSVLDVSQVRVASSPSLASQLSSSFLNVIGAAAGKNHYVWMNDSMNEWGLQWLRPSWDNVFSKTLNSTISTQSIVLTNIEMKPFEWYNIILQQWQAFTFN